MAFELFLFVDSNTINSVYRNVIINILLAISPVVLLVRTHHVLMACVNMIITVKKDLNILFPPHSYLRHKCKNYTLTVTFLDCFKKIKSSS